MFSAKQKNALLDQVKTIVDAGEITPRTDSDDSPHFDSAEITRYARAIDSLNDRYGWHLDAQKVLSKLGKKLGKKCGGGWISPEKKCKSHYTNGKLNEAGKASGENLADRIRQRKKLSTVSRNGKGKELSYAFLPGNQKQSTMAARKTRAPKNGYETPGRLSNVSSTEERRSIVGLGHNPGVKSKPDTAPIMDLPTKRASAPIEIRPSLAKRQKKFAGAPLSSESQSRKLNTPPTPIDAGKSLESMFAKSSGAASISEARTKKASAQDAEAFYRKKREDLEKSAIETRKTRDRIANAPVRIPNQRSSSEPRSRSRGVD